MLDVKAKPLDYEKIGRHALKHWRLIHSLICDLKGNPLAEVAALAPAATHKRRLSEFRLLSDGGWVNLGVGFGASGKDLIEVVQYLGACDRRTAAEFLVDILDRIAVVEVPA